MARGPLGPWRSSDGSEVAPAEPSGSLGETGLQPYADLYFVLGRAGFAPQVVDEMEAWQAAAVLGIGVSDHATGVDKDQVRSERDLIAERVAHAAGHGPRPEASKPGADVLDLVTRLA